MNSELQDLKFERLATMDAQGHRISQHPADVKGRYMRMRTVFQVVLLVLFLVLPWIQIKGKPAVLLDLAHRRFSILGLSFWAHDAPMLIFVAGTVLFGISLATAVWGRIWCGWACPETVFVERVYRQIERWIEGTAVQRRRLDQSPWTGRKLWLRSLKWAAFTAVTLIISHSFIAYFVGIDQLAEMVRHNPSEHPGTFGVMAFITAVLLLFFGWFREQFCIIMCPYGRFQSVLQDEHSKMVCYDAKRGEPRRASAKKAAPVLPVQEQLLSIKGLQGDCIDCFRCVQACPTGIDIRRGMQLECIGCMACVDACDEVMHNIKKPDGLIRYTSHNELEGKKINHFRTRVILLSLALTGVLCGLTYVLLTRPPIKATVFNAKTTAYQTADASKADVLLSNQFYLVASNYTFEDGDVKLELEGPLAAKVSIVSPQNPLRLAAGQEQKLGFFVTFPNSILTSGRARVRLNLLTRALDGSWKRNLSQEVPLAGPF